MILHQQSIHLQREKKCLSPSMKAIKEELYIYSFYVPLLKVKLWPGSLCFFAWIRKLESISFGVWLDDIWDTSKNACMLNISLYMFFYIYKEKKRELILRPWKNRIFMLHMKISLISSLNHSFLIGYNWFFLVSFCNFFCVITQFYFLRTFFPI